MTAALAALDHLVYAVPDLDAGVDVVERLLGIRATPGGSHPRWGTRNALLALGPESFLEIIGPDPQQPASRSARPFSIDVLRSPALVTWAIKSRALDDLVYRAALAGVHLGEIMPGRRARPDGVLLEWRLTDPMVVVADGLVPFAIDWGATPHPAGSAAGGATLVDLRAEHPDADRVQEMLGAVGVELQIRSARRPRLVATIDSPNGRAELS